MSARPPLPLLVWTGFDGSAGSHGGTLRTGQISELCRDAGFSPERIICDGHFSAGRRLFAGLRSAAAMRKVGIRVSPRQLSLYGHYRTSLDRVFLRHGGPKLLIWEETNSFLPPWLAKQYGFTVIALPQNMESLVGDASSISRLSQERAGLALSQRIVTIAEEESWLLANLGLPSDYLPYYPVRSRLPGLESIAAQRDDIVSESAPWLILGNAHHVPTREGMKTLLRQLQPALRLGIRVIVAGYGTEQIAPEFADSAIDFRGTIDNAQLDQLLASTRGILINQDRGAGALTRIPEALIARIPVVANRIAARSTRDYQGVHCFDSVEELLSLVRGPALPSPPPLAPPHAAIRRFTELLRASAQPSA